MSADQHPLPFPLMMTVPARRDPTGVADLLAHLAALIDHHGLDEVTLTGQLTGWRRTRAWGHADLITPGEGDGYLARIPLGIPGRAAAAIEARLARTHPGALSGTPTVVVTGAVEIHPRYGPLRVVVRTLHIDRDATSRTDLERADTLAALARAGIFDRQHHLALPEAVTSIGLIAGGSTAARADFEQRVEGLPGTVHLHTLEVATAGPGAPPRHRAGDRASRPAGPALPGRDPWRRARRRPHHLRPPRRGHRHRPGRHPVLTGIRHATDTTLADRAAHLALPTPSAVADHLGRHNTARAAAHSDRTRDHARRAAAAARDDLARQHHFAQAARARFLVAVAVCVVLAVAVLVLVLA